MKIVLLFSGGIDSTVLLAQYVRACEEVHCLTVDYEQRHKCEVEAAEKICKFYDRFVFSQRLIEFSCASQKHDTN